MTMVKEERYVKYNAPAPALGISPPCDREIMQSIRDKVIGQNPSNFFPEASPNYNPNTGRIELLNSKPVGMFESSSGSRPIATKWIEKD